MKINWKVRLKNKAFVVSMAALIVAFVYQILALFGIVPRVSQDTVTGIVGIIINALAALGVLVDPTTSGVYDSSRAMTYGTDEDARTDEIAMGEGK